jgi:hypothetical protein
MMKRITERLLLICGGVVLALLLLEVSLYLGYRIAHGRRFPFEDYRAAMHEQADAGAILPANRTPGEYEVAGYPEVIHPYLGFVPDPAGNASHSTIADRSQILPPTKSTLVVGVFGGSFAGGLCHFGRGNLRRALRRPGRSARILCVSAGGYKQPQQLLALAYILGLGGHFDIVINVDGLNEVALPPVENVAQGVAVDYPRGWSGRLAKLTDPETMMLLGGLYALDASRAEWARTFYEWGLYRSATLALSWEARDRVFDAERRKITGELNRWKAGRESSYAVTGPKMSFANDDVLYHYLAALWEDSSLQMKRLCDANEISYYHFLQPNQYVENSKPMTAVERRRAVRQGHPYQRGVVLGYPLLRSQGEELARAGVKFHDLTMVFADVREPMYKDDCCHLFPRGYAMIANLIGNLIRSDANGNPSKASHVQP